MRKPPDMGIYAKNSELFTLLEVMIEFQLSSRFMIELIYLAKSYINGNTMTSKPPNSNSDKAAVFHINKGFPKALEATPKSSLLESIMTYAQDVARFEWNRPECESIQAATFKVSALESLGGSKQLKISRQEAIDDVSESKVTTFVAPIPDPSASKKAGGNR